jgi:spore germination protein KA
LLLGYLVRKIRFLSQYKYMQHEKEHEEKSNREEQDQEMGGSLSENLDELLKLLANSNDVQIQPFRFGENNHFSGSLIYIDGMANRATLTDAILLPIKRWSDKRSVLAANADLLDILEQEILCSASVQIKHTLAEFAAGCLSGDTVLLVEGIAGGLIIDSKGWEKRSISEPQSESVVRGPREGFTENLRTNTSMIRRKIRHGQLRLEQMTVGRKTQTGICLMYLSGVANPKIVDAVRYRIKQLDVDAILESGYIEEYIEDAPFSPFATIGYSEKPDVVAGRILEGRVAIVVDGTPFVLTAPFLFVESFQTAEDYYTRPLHASLTRILRFIAYMLTIFAPAIYVALNSFHQELIPTTLLFTIAQAREGTPFPVFVEALIMIFAFDILREAGVRLPRPVGQAISIVGALVMGDAAVSAGIVGAPMVITIAFTAVAGFLVPIQNESASLLRVIMIIPAAFVGIYGVVLGFVGILIHLATLESFGMPYFDSFSHPGGTSDNFIRLPLWAMLKRPWGISYKDRTRGHFFIPPFRPFDFQKDDSEGEGS